MTTGGEHRQRGDFTAFTQRVILVLIVLALGLLVWKISYALLLAFISMLLSVLFRGAARLVSRVLPISTGWSLLIVAFLFLVLIVLFVWLAGPPISRQVGQFMAGIPNAVEQVRQTLRQSEWGQSVLEELSAGEISVSRGFNLISRITGYAMTLFDVAAAAILILFTSIFFSINPGVYIEGFLKLVPPDRTERFRELIQTTAHTLRYWLLGQLAAMVAVGTLVALGLWLIGVPQALLLGLIAGILEFVPFIGPVAAAVPGILIAFSQGWVRALYALLMYILVAQIEGQLITPLVQREAVHLPPALVILAVVAMGLLFGILGVIIATPLTAVLMVWIKMLYVEDVLGKPVQLK